MRPIKYKYYILKTLVTTEGIILKGLQFREIYFQMSYVKANLD